METPDVILELDKTVEGPDGRAYLARIRGHRIGEGVWEGWVEFEPQDGTRVLRTDRETEQHAREDLEYWAAGLTATYLEGAMERARRPRADAGQNALPGPPPDA